MKRLILLLLSLNACLMWSAANAQTHIYVQNNTAHDLVVTDVSTSGGRLSKKAWKQGETKIATGDRKSVLRINRTGKFNWMDPTPRFIEPGKTIIFSTVIAADGVSDAATIQLRQKLLGTGDSSDMWHSIEGTVEKHDWYNDDAEYTALWGPNNSISVNVRYRTLTDADGTHVEYVLGDSR